MLVPVNQVSPGAILASSIFAQGRILFRKGRKLTKNDLEIINQSGLRSIRIVRINGDSPRVGIIRDETRELAAKSISSIYQDYKNLNSRRFEEVKNLASTIVDEILASSDLKIQAHDLRTYDTYTYYHSVNVTVITTSIARLLGFDQTELLLLASGALMHDIGKMEIPQSILNKQTRLDADEIELVRCHPLIGSDLLCTRTNSSPLVWAIARQHHECLDGTGYPDHRSAEQIHLYAKIVVIADLWDALRSERPYKQGWPAKKVIDFLSSPSMQLKVEPEYVELLRSIVLPYPIESLVVLSNGMIGIVVEQNETHPTAPVVMIVRDEYGVECFDGEPQLINLVKESSLIITDSLD